MAPVCAGVLVFAGCVTVGPDYEQPANVAPDAWNQALAAEMSTGQPAQIEWWRQFGDDQLDTFITRARDGNPGLQLAVARIREARAIRRIAAGERVPDINLDGSVTRSRTSDVIIPPVVGFDRTSTFYELGPSATWELDFWGRIRRSVESADAGFQASIEDYRDVLVLLYADVARTYTDIRTLQARISFTESNIDTQRSALGLVQERNRAGLASDLEVHQAELNLYRTESFLPSLKAALAANINRLGVLLGETPDTLHAELSVAMDIPVLPGEMMIGVPGDLVRRRPDIRAAERNLAAQTARIGLAEAELYPRFALAGDFTLLATDVDDLIDWDSRRYSFGPFFSWNLFDGGRVRGQIQVEDARTEQALRLYEQTVLSALEDVESAMSAFVEERQRKASLERSATAAQRSVDLVLILYRTGLTDFQNVLDMQRSLFEQQDQMADSEGKIIKDLIRIYAAIGGGWDPDDLPAIDQ